MRRSAHVWRILCVGLAGAAAGLAVAVYLLSTEAVPHPGRWAALALVTSWSFVGSGVIAWIRRPANRIGPLMVATGVALLSRPIWPSASSPVLYSVTLAIDLVGYALFVHLLLAFRRGACTRASSVRSSRPPTPMRPSCSWRCSCSCTTTRGATCCSRTTPRASTTT